MSLTLALQPQAVRARWTSAELLVFGSSVVAPLNLLLVRSLTVYDLLIAAAFVVLIRDRALRALPRAYLAAAYVFLLAATLSAFRATHATEALTQIMQYAFIFFVQLPVVLTVVRTRRTAILCLALVCAGTLAAILLAHVSQHTQGSGRALVFYSENPNRLGYPAAYLAPLLIMLSAGVAVPDPGLADAEHPPVRRLRLPHGLGDRRVCLPQQRPGHPRRADRVRRLPFRAYGRAAAWPR